MAYIDEKGAAFLLDKIRDLNKNLSTLDANAQYMKIVSSTNTLLYDANNAQYGPDAQLSVVKNNENSIVEWEVEGSSSAVKQDTISISQKDFQRDWVSGTTEVSVSRMKMRSILPDLNAAKVYCCAASSGSKMIMAGKGVIAYSVDGQTWTPKDFIPFEGNSVQILDICYSSVLKIFVMLCNEIQVDPFAGEISTPHILYAEEAVIDLNTFNMSAAWTEISIPDEIKSLDARFVEISKEGSSFAVVGYDFEGNSVAGALFTDTGKASDLRFEKAEVTLVSFTDNNGAASQKPVPYLSSICNDGKNYYALSTEGNVYKSDDGVSWVIHSKLPGDIRQANTRNSASIAYSGGLLVAGGTQKDALIFCNSGDSWVVGNIPLFTDKYSEQPVEDSRILFSVNAVYGEYYALVSNTFEDPEHPFSEIWKSHNGSSWALIKSFRDVDHPENNKDFTNIVVTVKGIILVGYKQDYTFLEIPRSLNIKAVSKNEDGVVLTYDECLISISQDALGNLSGSSGMSKYEEQKWYIIDDDYQDAPLLSDDWTSNQSELGDLKEHQGWYLWTRTTKIYENAALAPSHTYEYSRISKDGEPGPRGEPGVGVLSETVQYCVSDSGSDRPAEDAGWVSNEPNVELNKGKYCWKRYKRVWTGLVDEDDVTWEYSCWYIGADGENGASWTESETKYAIGSDGKTSPDGPDAWKELDEIDTTNYKGSFLWTRMTTRSTKEGVEPIVVYTSSYIGEDGRPAKVVDTKYEYVIWSNGQDYPETEEELNKHPWSTVRPDIAKKNEDGSYVYASMFLWTKTITVYESGEEAYTYLPTYISSDGAGIKEIDYDYMLDDQGDIPPAEDDTRWKEERDEITAEAGKYIWTRLAIKYDDLNDSNTDYTKYIYYSTYCPKDGASVTGEKVEYCIMDDGTAPGDDATWTEVRPDFTAAENKGKYCWTRRGLIWDNIVDDDNITWEYSCYYMGADGATGAGITSSETLYCVGDNGTDSPENGPWTPLDAISEADRKGQYLWSRVALTLDNNVTLYSYTANYIGTDGESAVVTDTTYRYAIAADKTDHPDADATGLIYGWSYEYPKLSESKYAGHVLWTETTTHFNVGKSSVSYAPSLLSKDGTNGVGVAEVVYRYKASTDGVKFPGGSPYRDWLENPPQLEPEEFLWQWMWVKYTDSDDNTVDASEGKFSTIGYRARDGKDATVTTGISIDLYKDNNVDAVKLQDYSYNLSARGVVIDHVTFFCKISRAGDEVQDATKYVCNWTLTIADAYENEVVLRHPISNASGATVNNSNECTLRIEKYSKCDKIALKAEVTGSDGKKYTSTILITGKTTDIAIPLKVAEGIVDADKRPDKYNGASLIKGDYCLSRDTEGNVAPFIYTGAGWDEASDTTNYNDYGISKGTILMSVLGDAITSKETIKSKSIIYAFIETLVAHDAFISNLEISSKLQSSNYEESDGIPVTGWKADVSKGTIKSVGMVTQGMTAIGATIQGSIEHPSLKTVDNTSGKLINGSIANSTTDTTKTYWDAPQLITSLKHYNATSSSCNNLMKSGSITFKNISYNQYYSKTWKDLTAKTYFSKQYSWNYGINNWTSWEDGYLLTDSSGKFTHDKTAGQIYKDITGIEPRDNDPIYLRVRGQLSGSGNLSIKVIINKKEVLTKGGSSWIYLGWFNKGDVIDIQGSCSRWTGKSDISCHMATLFLGAPVAPSTSVMEDIIAPDLTGDVAGVKTAIKSWKVPSGPWNKCNLRFYVPDASPGTIQILVDNNIISNPSSELAESWQEVTIDVSSASTISLKASGELVEYGEDDVDDEGNQLTGCYKSKRSSICVASCIFYWEKSEECLLLYNSSNQNYTAIPRSPAWLQMSQNPISTGLTSILKQVSGEALLNSVMNATNDDGTKFKENQEINLDKNSSYIKENDLNPIYVDKFKFNSNEGVSVRCLSNFSWYSIYKDINKNSYDSLEWSLSTLSSIKSIETASILPLTGKTDRETYQIGDDGRAFDNAYITTIKTKTLEAVDSESNIGTESRPFNIIRAKKVYGAVFN